VVGADYCSGRIDDDIDRMIRGHFRVMHTKAWANGCPRIKLPESNFGSNRSRHFEKIACEHIRLQGHHAVAPCLGRGANSTNVPGFYTTNDDKMAAVTCMEALLSNRGIYFPDTKDFISATPQSAADNQARILTQLQRFAYIDKPALTPFGTPSRTVSGKTGGEPDDHAFCTMAAVYYSTYLRTHRNFLHLVS
jgi:hypothetical protein